MLPPAPVWRERVHGCRTGRSLALVDKDGARWRIQVGGYNVRLCGYNPLLAALSTVESGPGQHGVQSYGEPMLPVVFLVQLGPWAPCSLRPSAEWRWYARTGWRCLATSVTAGRRPLRSREGDASTPCSAPV